MKIVQYSQHVLGVGHFFRSLELAKSLKRHDVIMVSGGPPVDAELPAHIRDIQLPGLVMDPEFTSITAMDDSLDLDQVKQERRDRLWSVFEREKPDAFFVELYPFGRKAFRFELDPVLQGIRDGRLPPCRVVCSLRDILVEKKEQSEYEQRVIDTLNTYFHALVIHADPLLLRLEETFDRVADIKIPVVYSGFVTPKPTRNARDLIRNDLGLEPENTLIIASAGGGKVGKDLLAATIEAFHLIDDSNSYLHVFTGPFMDDSETLFLSNLSGDKVTVKRFTDRFPDFLAAADLSVSMAGYNTTMNLMAAGTPALVYPFEQNREQRLRAETFAELGLLTVMEKSDLDPYRLAGFIREKIIAGNRPIVTVNLDGAEHTAQWFDEFVNASRS